MVKEGLCASWVQLEELAPSILHSDTVPGEFPYHRK
jgi:hypothetical protein